MLILNKRTILSLEENLQQYKLKDDTMNESELQRVFIYPIYSRDSKI